MTGEAERKSLSICLLDAASGCSESSAGNGERKQGSNALWKVCREVLAKVSYRSRVEVWFLWCGVG